MAGGEGPPCPRPLKKSDFIILSVSEGSKEIENTGLFGFATE